MRTDAKLTAVSASIRIAAGAYQISHAPPKAWPEPRQPPPEPVTRAVDLPFTMASIARRLRDPDFDKSIHRFVLGVVVAPSMTVRHKHNRRHKWRRRLRKTDFRRQALNHLFSFLLHNSKDIGWCGPAPESTQTLADATLAIFEKLEPEKLKWLPPELACMLWPRTTAHMICESLGYAGATRAARIVWDGHLRQENWCEWINACYRNNAHAALQAAVKSPEWSPRRRRHNGYMASYRNAQICVARELLGRDPAHFGLAAWF